LSHSIGSPRGRLEQLFLDRALNPLQGILSKAVIEGFARGIGHRWRRCVYSPAATLLACVFKQSSPQVSCRDVEDWVWSKLPLESAPENNSGDDFCEARRRLPLGVFARALAHTAALAGEVGKPAVWLVDGTGLALPRCPELFAVFGRRGAKARMPGANLLLFTDAATGAVMQADLTGNDQGEIRQFLRCLDAVPADTTIVGDRQFGSYLAFHAMSQKGIGAVVRLNISRKPTAVERIGRGDEIQTWRKTQASLSAFPEAMRSAPETLRVRVVRRTIRRKGYRPVRIALATNLLDAAQWPPEKIVELYGLRWLAENDIRDLKLRHGLRRLGSKRADTVCKEVWAALLAYNAVKLLQKQSGRPPRKLSHERGRAIMMETAGAMSRAPTEVLPQLYRHMLNQLARAGLRRQERPPQPRAIVWDPTAPYPMLYRSRASWYQHYRAA